MDKEAKIYVAGHKGMVGSALVRRLNLDGFHNLIVRSSSDLDLRNQVSVEKFFAQEKPEYVFLAAAKVGGIVGNSTFRADFLYENLMIESNIIHQSYVNKAKKLLFLGSSCIYPKMAPQPLREDYLLSGFLEYTNEPYAIAKIAGIKLCENYRLQYGCNFISAMPTNLYGPNDNYDLTTSHVIPALMRKFYEGKVNKSASVEVWGSGKPMREFLHVDDVAEACVFLMRTYSGNHFINIGSGEDQSIAELADLLKKITEYEGEIVFDSTKPDGTPRKLMDVTKLSAMGWSYKIPLEKGLREVFEKEFFKKAPAIRS
jgi:GDP-L-fucose synthase